MASVDPWVSAATILALQFLAGVLIYSVVARLLARDGVRGSGARRRRLVVWTRASRALDEAAPFAVVPLLVGAAIEAGIAPASIRPDVWPAPLVFVALGGLPCASAYVMLHAAWRESRGRLRSARRQVRLGGQLLFVGAFAQLVMVWTDLLWRPAFRRAVISETSGPGLVLVGGMIGVGLAGFIGVLAGLAGKPRPSAYFSGACYALGSIGLIAAASLAHAGSSF